MEEEENLLGGKLCWSATARRAGGSQLPSWEPLWAWTFLLEGRGKQGSIARDGKGQLSVCLTSLFRAGFRPRPVAWRGRAWCFKCCLTQQCAMYGTF